jgi:hypothetical protein
MADALLPNSFNEYEILSIPLRVHGIIDPFAGRDSAENAIDIGKVLMFVNGSNEPWTRCKLQSERRVILEVPSYATVQRKYQMRRRLQ